MELYNKLFNYAKNKWNFTEDIIQDAFIVLLEKYPDKLDDEYACRNLLYKCCYNVNRLHRLEYAREQEKFIQYADYTIELNKIEELFDFDDEIIGDIRVSQIQHFLEKELDPVACYIFLLVVCHKHKYTDAAKKLTLLTNNYYSAKKVSKINNETIEYIKHHFNPNVLDDMFSITNNYKYKK